MARRKILIIEDDPVGRQILHKAVITAGYDVLLASDALSALTETQRGKPDLIVLDLGLPAGGGFAFLQRMKSFPRLAIIPILVVSGQDRAANEQRALDAGVLKYMEKPASPEDVLAEIGRLLE
ncbi:MAG TPA: response regulator [Thermoanaerobaculia bacterium]|nr:response regulator [Thermoanaerobaculia bacterium]